MMYVLLFQGLVLIHVNNPCSFLLSVTAGLSSCISLGPALHALSFHFLYVVCLSEDYSVVLMSLPIHGNYILTCALCFALCY